MILGDAVSKLETFVWILGVSKTQTTDLENTDLENGTSARPN